MSKQNLLPYSDMVIHIINATSVDGPYAKGVIYSTDIVRVNLDEEYCYRVSLKLQSEDENKWATILYGDFIDLETAAKTSTEILNAFREKQKELSNE